MAGRTAMAFRLSEEGKHLIQRLAEQYGVSQTAIIEVAIREKAKRDEIIPPPPEVRDDLRDEDAA